MGEAQGRAAAQTPADVWAVGRRGAEGPLHKEGCAQAGMPAQGAPAGATVRLAVITEASEVKG